MALIDDVAMIAEIDRVKHNDYLKIMIPLLIERAEDYCNNTFNQTNDEGELNPPGGVKIFVAESIKHKLSSHGLESRKMGSVSYSYDMDLPDKILKNLKPYRKVRFT